MNLQNDDYLSLTGDTEDINVLQNDNRLAELALNFPNVNSILIPKKAEYNLRRHVSKDRLRAIDNNINVAVEKCLVFLYNFASTYYTDDKWKTLNAEILHQQTKSKDNTYIYTRIIDVLKLGTSTGAFIEVMTNKEGIETYTPSEKSKQYRLTDIYLKAGLIPYTIKDAGIIQTRNRIFYQQLCEAMVNPICSNLINMYPKIDLPTSEELLIIGKRLVKEGRCTKKQKILTMRNRHPNDYWKDTKNRSFVEDNIELFEFLTHRGYMIPSAGGVSNGGRVVDSFDLMPAWIREQITVDGKKLTECDYICLHPNLAIHLYQGNKSYLTHEKVAERIGIDPKEIKIEHLSFFNKRWADMMKSPLFDYYQTHEADMMKRIQQDKKEHGYKITSRKMFGVEVNIMTDVIKYLNAQGVYVLYVYDALLCEEKDRALVMETMNRIILEHGVKTCVKVNGLTAETEGDEVEPTPEPIAVELPKFALDEVVSVYEVLDQLSFNSDDTMKVITYFDGHEIQMGQLVNYFGKQMKQQKYNDFAGVPITSDKIAMLRDMIQQ